MKTASRSVWKLLLALAIGVGDTEKVECCRYPGLVDLKRCVSEDVLAGETYMNSCYLSNQRD
jgi:hypothetical protein